MIRRERKGDLTGKLIISRQMTGSGAMFVRTQRVSFFRSYANARWVARWVAVNRHMIKAPSFLDACTTRQQIDPLCLFQTRRANQNDYHPHQTWSHDLPFTDFSLLTWPVVVLLAVSLHSVSLLPISILSGVF